MMPMQTVINIYTYIFRGRSRLNRFVIDRSLAYGEVGVKDKNYYDLIKVYLVETSAGRL
jgi:hypothetical protein